MALACLVAAAVASGQSASPPPTIAIHGGVGDEGGPIPFTVTLSRASDAPVTVDFITGDGTAVRGQDYHGRRGTLTIPAGQTAVVLAFNAIQDRWIENEERFRVELSNATGARFAGEHIDSSTIRNVFLPGRCTNLLDGRNRIDILTGSAGGDRIDGLSDQDVIFGLEGDDCLYGHAGADQIRGGDGDDKINGGTGNDRINGGAGDDHLIGTRGRDRYQGEEGDDLINARNGVREVVSCGPGDDRAIVDRRDKTRDCETIKRSTR